MIEREPLELDEGLLSLAKRLGRSIKRKVFTPEFVRHCVVAVANKPRVAAKIKQRSTVHGVCKATYRKSSRKGELKRLHPKGSHHSYDAYVAAADKLGEATTEMTMIDKIKIKRIEQSLGDRLPRPHAEADSSESPSIDEGKKEHQNPTFVRKCVDAITQDKDKLEKIERDGGDGEDKGSPFAVCHAQYNKNKRSLAAKHTDDTGPSEKQWKSTLSKLRESLDALRNSRPPRTSIVFDAQPADFRKRAARRDIQFDPNS